MTQYLRYYTTRPFEVVFLIPLFWLIYIVYKIITTSVRTLRNLGFYIYDIVNKKYY